jgi:hypothetical protein
MAELHNADWGSTNESATYEGHWNNGARFKVYDRQSTPIMAALHDYFSGPEYRQKLIAHFYEQMPKFFQETWADWSQEQMFRRTNTHCEFLKDLPGTQIPLHTDSRLLLSGGMIYFSEHDDPRISTSFYSDLERNNKWTAKTDYCNGWLAANLNDSYHDGGNFADYDRYGLMYWFSVAARD